MKGKKLQIFISSTYEDMKAERQIAVEAILAAGHIPAGMELFTAGSQSQWKVITDWINASDVFVLILGGRYGTIEEKSQLSYIHLEYEYAIKKKKPFFALVISEKGLKNKIKKLGNPVAERDNVDKFHSFRTLVTSKMVRFWDDEKDIKTHMITSIQNLEETIDLTGWIRNDPGFIQSSNEFKKISSELQGLQLAMGRYKSNINEGQRRLLEVTTKRPIDISGHWCANEKPNVMEILSHSGSIVSYFKTGSHEHWLYGIWSTNLKEIITQIWRRELMPYEGTIRRTTIMWGKIHNITEDEFTTECFATDGKADLSHDYFEVLTWNRIGDGATFS